jgi:peptidoglycan/xylan/chitin deacetylase (PgdA/CDA1 family)
LTERREPLPRKSVVITFDDGYTDNYDHAYKILKKYGYPATIFVPSDLVNNEGYLNWVQMRKMINNGITIGSHTRRHAYLPDLSIEEQWDEIAASKKILETNLGVAVDYFSYPIGGFNDAIKQLVKKAGYKGATATNRGYDRLNKDVFELNRIRFSDKDHRIDYLWMKLSGYYNLFREAKAPY